MSKNDATLATRLQDLRKSKNYSQSELAKLIGISYTQMSRYENKGVQPPADTLKKLADFFDVTIDFLVVGDSDTKAKETLQDAELINQFKKVANLPDEEKSVVLKFITAFVRDFNTQQAYAN